MSLKFNKYISSESVDVNTESEREYFHPSVAISKKSITKYKQIFDGLYIITDRNTGSNQIEILSRADTFLVDQLPADPIASSQDKLYVYIILSEPEAYVYIQLSGNVRNKWEKLSDVKYLQNQGVTDNLLYGSSTSYKDPGYYFLVTSNPAISVPDTSDIINIGLESSIARYEQISETNMLAAMYSGELLCIAPDDIKEVTSVSSYSFNSIRNLHTVEFPDSVTHISSNAIYKCPHLSKITIPKNVISLSNAFYGNSNLSEIKFKGNVEEWCQLEGPIFASNGQTCPKLYIQDSFIEYLTIPETATKIGKSLFIDYTHLKEVHIPASISRMGEQCFQSCSKLTAASINVKAIPYNAFTDCHKLTDLTFGDAVEKIGDSAFDNCSSLKTVSLPEGLKTISANAFYYCSNLQRITLPSTLTDIASNAFYGCSRLSDIYIKDLSAYCTAGFNSECDYMNLYLDNELVTELIIPNNTTHISLGAFNSNKNLISVTLPSSVTQIFNSAFSGCKNLRAVDMQSGVTYIGPNAFQGCTSLTSITIPDSVTSVGDSAFRECSNLVSVHAADISKWCEISFGSFNSNPLSYAHTLYSNGEPVTTLIVPDSVTKIGNHAFEGCTSLTSVTISNSATNITSIGKGAFSGCSNLTSVTIPDSVTSIGDDAFYNCSNLTSITVGNSVTSIGDEAFYSCESLTSITIPNSVTSVGDEAFRYCSSLTIYCEAASKPSDWFDDWNYSNRPVVWGYNNITSNSEYDYLVHNGMAILTKYKGTDTEIIIPSTIDGYVVTSFGEIFKNNAAITSAVIPNSVTTIDNYAFYGCERLTRIEIPSSVARIGKDAFSKCESLTSIEIPNSVKTIGDGVFGYCTKLTNVTIPNSVTYIGKYAFESCTSLKRIIIPDSITSTGSHMFWDCTGITIYCEAPSQPSGWNSVWNTSKGSTFWGYTGEKYTYTFVTNGGTSTTTTRTDNSSFALPTATREGWYFGGWYDNPELFGNPVSSPYSSKTVHTLYAKWLTEEEYLALRDGTSFEKAYIITPGHAFNAVIDTAGEYVYFVFTATESKTYTFQSNGSCDTYGYLYSSSQSELSSNDDGGNDSNFLISRSMSAGEVVYLKVKLYSSSSTGTFTVSVS